MENTTSFGYWVRRRRKALDLTQANLARQVGCAPVTIKKIEGDERRPSRQMVERLADCLAIPAAERDRFIQCGLGQQLVDQMRLTAQPVEPPVPPVPTPVPAFFEASAPERVGSSEGSRFVGREAELEQLAGYLAAAMAGHGQVVFVTGEAGRGKTALLAEFARQAQAAQPELIVTCGYCNAYASIGDPYLPFRDVMEMLAGDVEGRWAAGVVGREQARRLWTAAPLAVKTLLEVGPDLIDLLVSRNTLRQQDRFQPLLAQFERQPGLLEQRQLFEQVTKALQSLARQQPLLILLDDLQWADATSINLLFHLGRRLAGSRILIVGAYRPSEIALGRPGGEPERRQQHALEPVINEFRRHFGDIQVDLGRFEPGEGRKLVDALLDREPNRLPESFRVALFWQTKGHPLFTIELVREMQARGDLIQDDTGHWALKTEQLNWEMLPARVEAVIEQRLGRLDEPLRALLAVASVEGENFTAEVVARVQQMNQRQLLRCLSQELDKRHHLVRERAVVELDQQRLCRYQFAHVLFQQYLYHWLSQGERILLHAEVAQALEALYQGQTEAIAVQLAHHYAEAGDRQKAIDYLLQAGDQAHTLYAHQEAIGHYERALAFLREERDLEGAARTLMKLGHAYHIAFNFERSHRAYAEGFALWQQVEAEQPMTNLPPAPHPLRLVWQDPPSLDATLAGTTLTAPVVTQLFSGLVGQSPEMEVIPDVAYRWEVLDEGHKYIFYLREDVYWSDGQRVTAADFEFTFKRALDPATKAPVAGLLLYGVKGAREFHQGRLADAGQVGIYAPNETTLVIELEAPVSYFMQNLSYYVLLPVPRHVVEAHGPTWAEPEHIVTNGPFCLAAWRRGEIMRLERNPRYHGRFTGNVQQVELTLGVSPSGQFDLYEADRVDIVYSWFFSSFEIDPLRQRHAGEYLRRPRFASLYLIFNVSRPPFDDVRVRRAFVMAIDRERLANGLYKGYELPGTGGFVPPGMPGHSAGISLPYDPAQAQQLLAEAGYPEGHSFPEVRYAAYHTRRTLADYLQVSWHETLNIKTRPEIVEAGVLLDWVAREQPPIAIGGWWADYADPDNFLRVDVDLDVPEWRNETYQRLLDQARQTTDQAERMQVYQQADRILMEEAVIAPLSYSWMHLLLKPWIRKFPTTAVKNPGFWKDVVIEPHS
jgi:oligopeptide transport system substrate-binding protein